MEQTAVEKTIFGETDLIATSCGSRKGCLLSPILFNIHYIAMIRKTLENFHEEIMIRDQFIKRDKIKRGKIKRDKIKRNKIKRDKIKRDKIKRDEIKRDKICLRRQS